MIYLSRLCLSNSRAALGWLSNAYRVHQRLLMACEGDPRLLFRVEEDAEPRHILVQTHSRPQWERAFGQASFLSRPPEMKAVDPMPAVGQRYRFRLVANPTVKRDEKRVGLVHEEEQRAWLARKLSECGASLEAAVVSARGFQRSSKGSARDTGRQTHLMVRFEGILRAEDPERLRTAIQHGIGPAKGYGCGLLSVAPLPARLAGED